MNVIRKKIHINNVIFLKNQNVSVSSDKPSSSINKERYVFLSMESLVHARNHQIGVSNLQYMLILYQIFTSANNLSLINLSKE